eukprot:CAMPEP_0117737582 /NCGR_PEP_ID=MMETSP0947-20121206/2620_1 /TAXON_ID=44440 /ORGANISM="Chattonella subsalsa, Strain CCMP2191" /LENGTH=379 /DNA_ID=CAMNT_0005553109 /DNA_START=118 /DNA_END=1254 /DNA_ORIENTATION=-
MFNFGENYHRLVDGAASGIAQDAQQQRSTSSDPQNQQADEKQADEESPNESSTNSSDQDTSHQLRPLKIRVLDTQGRTYKVTVPGGTDSTVESLKDQLVEIAGVQKDLQRLIYHGRILQDNKTLKEYNVEDDTVIHLFARPAVSTFVPRAGSTQQSSGPAAPSGTSQNRAIVINTATPIIPINNFAQLDFPLLQSSRRIRFLSAFLFLICSMQVMAILAMFASYWDHKTSSQSSGGASNSSENGSGSSQNQFGIADYVLLIINMFGMAVGILGMRGSQTFDLRTVEAYFKGLLFTGVATMLMKTYYVFKIAAEVMDGTYPGMETNSTASGNPSNNNTPVGETGSDSDTSSSSNAQKTELTGADILSDALFSTTIAAIIW